MREEFFEDLKGKRFVKYGGLLDEFHTKFERYSRSIETELLQVPSDENGKVAICRAVVKAWSHDAGQGNNEYYVYTGIGDASPENVSRNIVPHIIRQAETRSKARALRDAINVGVTSLEELGGEEEPPAPLRPVPQEADLRNEHNYIYSMLEELGADVKAFEDKHGAISEYNSEKSAKWIEALQKRLDTKRALAENPEESAK